MRDLLFIVVIDCNLGLRAPDWEPNTAVARSLFDALEEAIDCRRKGFPAKVLLCGFCR